VPIRFLLAALASLMVFLSALRPAEAAEFSIDGVRLTMSGTIYGRHEFETLSKLIRENPAVKIVVMKNFYGGRAGTAGFFNFTKFIRDNKLATEVDGACVSACAIAFMGGVQRSVSPKADPKKSFVAFHGLYIRGGKLVEEYEPTYVAALQRYYGGRMPAAVAKRAYTMPKNGFLAFFDGRKAGGEISVILCEDARKFSSGGCKGITDVDAHKVGVYTN
jgi:hypothetical protein